MLNVTYSQSVLQKRIYANELGTDVYSCEKPAKNVSVETRRIFIQRRCFHVRREANGLFNKVNLSVPFLWPTFISREICLE